MACCGKGGYRDANILHMRFIPIEIEVPDHPRMPIVDAGGGLLTRKLIP